MFTNRCLTKGYFRFLLCLKTWKCPLNLATRSRCFDQRLKVISTFSSYYLPLIPSLSLRSQQRGQLCLQRAALSGLDRASINSNWTVPRTTANCCYWELQTFFFQSDIDHLKITQLQQHFCQKCITTFRLFGKIGVAFGVFSYLLRNKEQ